MNTVAFRRHLHAHPELSFREQETAAFISAQLAAAGIEHRPIAGDAVQRPYGRLLRYGERGERRRRPGIDRTGLNLVC